MDVQDIHAMGHLDQVERKEVLLVNVVNKSDVNAVKKSRNNATVISVNVTGESERDVNKNVTGRSERRKNERGLGLNVGQGMKKNLTTVNVIVVRRAARMKDRPEVIKKNMTQSQARLVKKNEFRLSSLIRVKLVLANHRQ